MRGRIKKVLCCLMALFMVLAICPISSRAAERIVVFDVAALRQAITNASEDDTIVLGGYISLNSSLEITKSVTLELSASNLAVVDAGAIVVNNCKVKIKGGGGISAVSSASKALVIVKNGGEVTFEDKNLNCQGILVTEDDSDNNRIIIKDGSYNYYNEIDNDYKEIFDIKKGTVEVYAGTFMKEIPSGFLASDTECVEVPDPSSDYGKYYKVRSTIKGDIFNQAIPDDEIVVSAVKPKNDKDGAAYIEGALAQYGTDEGGFYATCIDLENNIYDVTYNDYNTSENETHRITVKFTGEVSDAAVSRAKTLTQNLPKDEYGSVCINMSDMEVVNMWANGFDPEKTSCVTNMPNYSLELKKSVNNANIDFLHTTVQAGDISSFFNMGMGNVILQVDDVGCGMIEGFTTYANHIIYVSADTATDSESLMKAAQKRIDEYLGSSEIVKLTYGGTFATFPGSNPDCTPEEERLLILDCMGLQTAPEYYFTATVGNQTFNLFIIPAADTKMINPVCKTEDIITKVSIETTSSKVPLDASIRASAVTSGAAYDNIIDKLKVDKELTYDLKLYSGSQERLISKLEDGSFKVSVPITDDDLKGVDLSAYYIDDAGNIEEHPVTVVDNEAKFETTHFSIYTIAKASPDVCSVNGKAHKLTAVPGKAATTTAEGNKAYWTCDCGKWFADADGKTEITDKSSVIIPKLKETAVDGGDKDTTTEAENTKNSTGSPATGDTTNLVFLFGLMFVSATALLLRRKKTK